MRITTSVIISAYNYARFLPRCLESVLSQSHPADEIVVVDDGSTDETPDVVSRFASVRYIRQNRAGKAEAFNRGFRESKGDLICHLDADDYWLPEKLDRVTESLLHCSSGGVIHEAFYVDEEDRYLYGSEHQKETTNTKQRLFSFQDVLALCFIYRPQNTVASSLGVANTICVRRDTVADCFPLPADLGLAVDGALLLGAARQGLLYLPDKLSVYRHHGNNHFVSDPQNQKYQRRLFSWVSGIPGIAAGDKNLLEALALESGAHTALHNGGAPLKAAGNATLLLLKLTKVGLVPNWKHFGLPIASLVGWNRIRSVLRPGG